MVTWFKFGTQCWFSTLDPLCLNISYQQIWHFPTLQYYEIGSKGTFYLCKHLWNNSSTKGGCFFFKLKFDIALRVGMHLIVKYYNIKNHQIITMSIGKFSMDLYKTSMDYETCPKVTHSMVHKPTLYFICNIFAKMPHDNIWLSSSLQKIFTCILCAFNTFCTCGTW
jgi:hypothetical protein